MTDIIKEIELLMFDYEINTGFKPTRLYLGRQEMLALGQWALDNGYQYSNKTAAQECKSRPEVCGLVAYEVNDDGPHMRCCR